jgi:hypothetical protein
MRHDILQHAETTAFYSDESVSGRSRTRLLMGQAHHETTPALAIHANGDLS